MAQLIGLRKITFPRRQHHQVECFGFALSEAAHRDLFMGDAFNPIQAKYEPGINVWILGVAAFGRKV